MNENILILAASAGSGHLVAAQGLQQTYEALAPASRIINRDCLDYIAPWASRLYRSAYTFLTSKAPNAWRQLYNNFDQAGPRPSVSNTRSAGLLLQQVLTAKVPARIEAEHPRAVVTAHFMPGQILGHIERSYPVYEVITDYVVHGSWINEGVDGYFVASDEAREMTTARGVDPALVHVTGIPVRPPFANPPHREDARRTFGIPPDELTVLLVSGGWGAGSLSEIAHGIAHIRYPMTLVTVAGSNETERRRLGATAWPAHVNHIGFGFTQQMADIMAAADLLVTKAGGLTVAEGTALGLPFVLLPPIPGQEEGNANWLEHHGAGLVARNPRELHWHVERMMFNKGFRQEFAARSRELGKPNAARAIIEAVTRQISP